MGSRTPYFSVSREKVREYLGAGFLVGTSHRTIASERSERAATGGPLSMTTGRDGVTAREDRH